MRKLILAAVLGMVLSAGLAQPRRADVYVYRKAAATKPAKEAAKTRPAATQPASLDGARKLYWRGKYAEAIAAYEKLAKSQPGALRAAIGLAEARAATGKYAEAMAALRAVAARGRRDAEWQMLTSRLHSLVGEHDKALAAAQKAHELRGDWAPTVVCLGQALETVGRKKEAVEVYKGVDKAIAKADFKSDARSLVAAGQALDRYAILTGKKASEQAQNILHNYLQEAYQKVDKEYWPANVAAGILLLEKHKAAQAAQEFALAAKINPKLTEVHVGRAILLLGRYRFEQAIAEADKALKINPVDADANLVKAASKMLWRKFDQVAPELEKVLKTNPNHLEALSLMAALHARRFEPEKAKPFIQRVEKVNPAYAELYEAIGDWLSAGRQFDLAESYYQKAMKMAPELAGPVTGLGRLYMQTGREELAKETLAKAFAIDDYRGDVRNYLNLLESMKRFEVRETEHFIIKVDPKYDAVLLDWMAEVAEQIHTEVCKDFQHKPGEKTLVEMFPNHGQFSVRISGKGWIGTVGACTGRVIAMPAPDPLRGGFGQFNWYVVLRHEYTHTVTLSATRNRIPHWFTEACAVWEQPDRRNFRAVAMLVQAVRGKGLFDIESLDWGFIRPRRRGARSLAYAQSEWIFEYIDEKKGRQAIYKMLKGFRDGWTQRRVFQEVLGTTEAAFNKDFGVWAAKQIASWGFDPKPPPKLADAAKAAKAKPNSAEAQADLALACYRARRRSQAAKAARTALEIDPKQKRALAVLGRILTLQKKYGEAIEVARRLEAEDPGSAEAAKTLAKCHRAELQWKEAVLALERYKKRLPLDPYGYEELAKIYDQLGRPREALPNLMELHRRTMKKPEYARKIADIYRASDAPAEAVKYYEQVIQINPYDTGTYRAMASLCLRTGDHDRALRAMRSASVLEPKSARTWAELAVLYYRIGRARKSRQMLTDARQAAEKAVKIDPESYGKEVLEMIRQAGTL